MANAEKSAGWFGEKEEHKMLCLCIIFVCKDPPGYLNFDLGIAHRFAQILVTLRQITGDLIIAF